MDACRLLDVEVARGFLGETDEPAPVTKDPASMIQIMVPGGGATAYSDCDVEPVVGGNSAGSAVASVITFGSEQAAAGYYRDFLAKQTDGQSSHPLGDASLLSSETVQGQILCAASAQVRAYVVTVTLRADESRGACNGPATDLLRTSTEGLPD